MQTAHIHLRGGGEGLCAHQVEHRSLGCRWLKKLIKGRVSAKEDDVIQALRPGRSLGLGQGGLAGGRQLNELEAIGLSAAAQLGQQLTRQAHRDRLRRRLPAAVGGAQLVIGQGPWPRHDEHYATRLPAHAVDDIVGGGDAGPRLGQRGLGIARLGLDGEQVAALIPL